MNEDGGGGGLLGTLKSKAGPLPVWGWLAAITVILLGWWLYEQHKNGGTGGTPTPATPSDVGQPGVVVINQGDTDTDPTAPPPEPKHKGGGGGDNSPESPHKVTRAEAQTLLKEKHTVYTKNRGGTYVPVTSLAGVHDQLFTGERAWDILQKQRGGKSKAGSK